MNRGTTALGFVITLSLACSRGGQNQAPAGDTGPAKDSQVEASGRANVVSVAASGTENQYTFAVTLRTPDTGCDQYADWWEVFDPSGELLYRRILAHSHVDEQPFTRSGGPVPISADREVVVRAHMSNSGYGGIALRGSVSSGFNSDSSIDADFHPELATAQPLPSGCAF